MRFRVVWYIINDDFRERNMLIQLPALKTMYSGSVGRFLRNVDTYLQS